MGFFEPIASASGGGATARDALDRRIVHATASDDDGVVDPDRDGLLGPPHRAGYAPTH